MIAIPDFASGAMENWGLITYREKDLLYDEKQSSFLNKERVATVSVFALVSICLQCLAVTFPLAGTQYDVFLKKYQFINGR